MPTSAEITRAQMMAAVNATRPSSQSSSMTDEQLMSLLQHPDPKVRDAARRELDSRRQSGSSTADLVNETRPIPAVPVADNGWKGGKFDQEAANQEVRDSQARAAQEEADRRAEFEARYGDGTYDYRGAADSVRRDRGLRKPASEQEQLDAIRAAQIADLERQREEEAALKAHNARVAGLGSTPADLDPVAAAGTPVTPDPPVRGKKPTSKPRSGPYGRTVPGPVTVDGKPVAAPEAFASQEEADAYNTRRVLSQDEAAPVTVDPLASPQVNPQTGLAGSQRDIDMRRRGFVPVQGRDGNITYMLEADTSGETVGGPGRAGVRDDLGLAVNDDGSSRWEPQTRTGPLGTQTVYAPTDAFRKQVRDNVQARSAARAARDAERQKMVVMQAQATQRPMNFLNNPNADPWAKRMLSEAMLRSGRPGATPLDVQGQQMQNMQNIAQQLAVGALQAGPAQAQLEAAERERRERREAEARAAAARAAPSTRLGMAVPPGLRWQRAYDAAIGAGVDGATAQRIADDVVGGASAPAGDGREDGRAVPPAGREPPA